jgi:outer membrane protein assembly factor BamB
VITKVGFMLGWVAAAMALLAAACSPGSTAASSSVGCVAPRVFTDEMAEFVVEPLGEPVWAMEPDEATFSSPRLADLTGDGVLDVVQGFGQDTFGDRQSSVIATNGSTGAELWKSTGHEDLVGSATFAQLGGDDTLDVVIGGRRGALLAIDGATGSLLWSFDDQGGRWFNFYTSQVVDDQNGDEVVDLVAVNGGLVFDEPAEGGGIGDADDRHLGTVFVVSGADGSVIAKSPVPDRGESYMSPVLVPDRGSGPEVLVGTGGETLPGALWRLPLSALIDGELGVTEAVVSGGAKGVIAAPSLADLTGDCVVDIVTQAFDGTLTAVDGASSGVLWTVANAGFETYSTPSLGYFVGDDGVPDVFASVARGVWPEYESSDGATGQVVWRETLGSFAPSGFVAGDLNGDGRDEVIFGVNDVAANTHQLYVLDTNKRVLHALSDPLAQTTFSSPWLGDIDGDGELDLITTASAYQSSGPARVERFILVGTHVPGTVSWGGYLGTAGTGVLGDPGGAPES